jgi:hypothetical protein
MQQEFSRLEIDHQLRLAMEADEPATKADVEDLRRLVKQVDRHVSELSAAIVRLLASAKEVANA